MPQNDFVILIGSWLLWMLPFLILRMRRRAPAAVRVDRRARWGILLEMFAYWLIWAGPFWQRHPSDARVAASIVFFALGAVLSWTGTRALGRQWRVDAGLSADHELVRSGPYRIVRHPIYASMFAMLLGTGFLIARWSLFALSLPLFLAGTEIRVRVEDALLAGRFGSQALEYQKQVAAYVPFIR